MAATWRVLHDKFKKVGAAPETCALDDEISKDSLDSFDSERAQHQLVTP